MLSWSASCSELGTKPNVMLSGQVPSPAVDPPSSEHPEASRPRVSSSARSERAFMGPPHELGGDPWWLADAATVVKRDDPCITRAGLPRDRA